MSEIVLLDSAPLGMLSNPKSTPDNEECRAWLAGLLVRGVKVGLPEIADYEVRRELLRADKLLGVARLDALQQALTYLPISTPLMLMAAEFWASARKRGKKSADDAALDGDVLVAAQAVLLMGEGDDVVIATSNVRHLSLFAPAKPWREIARGMRVPRSPAWQGSGPTSPAEYLSTRVFGSRFNTQEGSVAPLLSRLVTVVTR
jgi:predicted nucleic acid-binding protein